MAQAFVTTYKNYFRWPEIERRKSLRPVDKFAQELPRGDIWIVPKKIGEDDGEGGESLQSAQAAVQRMYRRRLWSTYQTSYCKDMIPEPDRGEEEAGSFDNALLFYCKSLYGPKKKKIPPPLPTARRIYGYIRPARMYIPLTTYQDVHGRVGYQILDHPNSETTALMEVAAKQMIEETKRAQEAASKDIQKDVKTKKRKPVVVVELDISKVLQKPDLKLDNCPCALKRRR